MYGSVAAAAAAKSLQLCPTLCDPIDTSAQGGPAPGILQARTLEWVAIFILLCNINFPRFLSAIGCYKILNIVPCAVV